MCVMYMVHIKTENEMFILFCATLRSVEFHRVFDNGLYRFGMFSVNWAPILTFLWQ